MAHDGAPLTIDDLVLGSKTYEARERRARTYWEALETISRGWPTMEKVAEGIGILLRSWNRFQSKCDYQKVAAFLQENREFIETYRARGIFSFDNSRDDPQIATLFCGLLEAEKSSRGLSPVGVAKSLNLLAPSYFPLWDGSIATHYECFLTEKGYIRFMTLTRNVLRDIVDGHSKQRGLSFNEAIQEIENRCSFQGHKKSLLKILDEYNYAKYFGGWIR